MSDLQPADLKQYTKRCFYVFFGVVCGTLTMVAASFAPIENHGLKIALILAIAAVNASLVVTFLMHIVSEKRFVMMVISLTLFLFIALMALSAIAHFDLPRLMAH